MDQEDVSFGGKFGALTAFLEDLVLSQHLNPQNNQAAKKRGLNIMKLAIF